MPWAQARNDALTALVSQGNLPLGALLFGLLIAFAFGAAHALSPGHGKTVVAAYLVGSRGTAAHAAFLGVTVTVSHTIGVFLFGLVVLYASQYIVPEQLYPWLGVVSGLLIVVVGLTLFQRRRTWRRATANGGRAPGAPMSLRPWRPFMRPALALATAPSALAPLAANPLLQRHAGASGEFSRRPHSHDHRRRRGRRSSPRRRGRPSPPRRGRRSSSRVSDGLHPDHIGDAHTHDRRAPRATSTSMT